MRLAIRDDDTNYFTQPEQLERVYGAVWDICPVSLSVVPFQACTRSGAIPQEYWRGDGIFPIGENKALVGYLRGKIAAGQVSVNQHGYTHQDYLDGYEFEAGADLSRKVREGKRYLEDLFGVAVNTFVPPHNALSKRGWKAVLQSYRWLLGPLPQRPSKRPWHARNVVNFLRWRWFCWRRTGHWGPTVAYPFVLDYGRYSEFICTTLTPLVSLARLQAGFAAAREAGGSFCLATHYWEFDAMQEYEPIKMGEVFDRFWSYVQEFDGIEFCAAGELFTANRRLS
jgi:hypothetical protein